MSTLVFCYGLLPPTTEDEAVAAQMWSAHVYQNKLTELEQQRRTEREKALGNDSAVAEINRRIADLTAKIEAARAKLSKARSDARNKTAGDNTEAKNLYAALKQLWPERKAAVKAALEKPEIQTALTAIEDHHKKAIRESRAICNVYWGTYLQIEAANDQARKSVTPPRFHRWTGDGAVAVQLQKGLKVEDATGCKDQRLRLSLTPIPVPGRSGRPLPTLSIRIGSDEKRNPIFAQFPIVYHRSLPADAAIKWVKVVRRRIGTNNRWSVHFTLTTEEPISCDLGDKTVAVNLRWAKAKETATDEPQSIIAADWFDGQHGCDLKIDSAISSMLAKSDELRSIRDKEFEKTKAILKEFITKLNLPAEHKKRLEFLHAWKATAKLAAHVIWWRTNRFEGDSPAFFAMESWRKQDKHLYDWEANARRKALARRRDGYRVFAASVANTHKTLLIERLNIARLAEKPQPEEEREVNPKASSQRFATAPSELRSALVNAFRMRGGNVVEVPAGMSSNQMLAFFREQGGDVVPKAAARSVRFKNLRKKAETANTPTAPVS